MCRMLVLETERLSLRTMTLNDVDNLLQIFSDPVAMRHYPSTIDRAGAVEWVERNLGHYNRHGAGFWIVERTADALFLGQCGLIPQKTDDGMETEVAYLFARHVWGHGYATEAARACRDWGFHHLDVPRLVSVISVHNTPSIKVAERNGMVLSTSLMKPNGEPHHVYAISREDWRRDVGALNC
jgi:RimJ/RimL family protein N-acetyltransferase